MIYEFTFIDHKGDEYSVSVEAPVFPKSQKKLISFFEEELGKKIPENHIIQEKIINNEKVYQVINQTLEEDKTKKYQYDVFLCHNSDDKTEIEFIYKLLKKEGILPWLDKS